MVAQLYPRISPSSTCAERETVHEHLQALNARLCARITAVAEENIKKIQNQFDVESAAVVGALSDRSNKPESGDKCELPSTVTVMQLTPHALFPAVTKLAATIKAVSGPHEGLSFTIYPQKKRLVPKVGRSTGKQFVKNGISLPDDGEVSTMHGRFDVSEGALWYTDTNSTNGTLMHGNALSPRDAVRLAVGDAIVVGQTELRVCSVEPA